MRFRRIKLGLLCVTGLAVFCGCSMVEPRHGTRVVLSFAHGRPSRSELGETCRFLVSKSRHVLGVERARVKEFSETSLTLQLPGKRLSTKDIKPLLAAIKVEFHHLRTVATAKHPDRPWKLTIAPSTGAPVFTGPRAVQIDSALEPREVVRRVLGPASKPLLRSRDLASAASVKQSGSAWAVMLRLNRLGAQRFSEFTRANSGEYIGIFVDGRLVSAPMVTEPITGGETYVTGFRSAEEADSTAGQINAGELPVALSVRSVRRY